MKLFYLSCFLFLPTILFSQDVDWYKNTWKSLRGMEVNKDGVITISGIYDHSEATIDGVTLNTAGSGMDFHDIFLARYSTDGELIWVQTSIIDDSGYQGLSGLAVDEENASIISGSFGDNILFSGLPLSPDGYSDIFVAKYDENGTCVWSKKMGGPQSDFGYEVKTDGSNNIYVKASFSESITIDGQTAYGSSTQPNQVIIKLDPNGNLVWLYTQHEFPFTEFEVSKDGNVFLAGNSNKTIDINGAIYSSSSLKDNMYVYKLKHDGSLDWFKYFDSDNGQSAGNLLLDQNESVYFSFNAYDTLSLENQTYFEPDSRKVLKLNNQGEFEWFSQFLGDTSECVGSYLTFNQLDEVCFPCLETELIDSTNFNNYVTHGWMYASIDPFTGQVTKHEMHDLNYANRLKFDKYGSIYATGYKWGGNQFDESDYDHLDIGSFFYKIDGPLKDFGDELVLYPNPSTGFFSLQIETDSPMTFATKIYDQSGRIVSDYTVDSDGFLIHQIDATEWASGIYTGTFISESKNYQFRLLKQ